MKQDILNLWSAVKDSFETGGFKYFFHNLSVNCRRWQFCDRKTRLQKMIFSFGVFLISPTGNFLNVLIKNNWLGNDRQWEFHPLPWVAKKARSIRLGVN